ncbi:MAG: hypothetical protein AAB590_03005 [Patescibacteria group bacterium]
MNQDLKYTTGILLSRLSRFILAMSADRRGLRVGIWLFRLIKRRLEEGDRAMEELAQIKSGRPQSWHISHEAQGE